MKRSERYNDPEESFRLAYKGEQSKMWTSIPGIVDSVDLDTQTLSVQPSIQGIVLDEESNATNVNLPLCVDVPIVWPRAGGFSLTFPIKAGDEVLLVFASRCIDSWWQNGGVGSQAELRMHDLSDGVQLRTDSGTSYIEITPDGKINILTNSEVNINANDINISSESLSVNSTSCSVQSSTVDINASSTVSIIAATAATIQAPTINLIGNVSTSGGGLSIDGADYEQHRHSGVRSGGANSGPVV
jgi:phage baseplate assembly protein gpV